MPKHGPVRLAVEETLRSLDGSEAFAARVAAFRGLADAVDAEPLNASLWREFRAVEAAVMELRDGGDSELDDLIRSFAEVGDTADRG